MLNAVLLGRKEGAVQKRQGGGGEVNQGTVRLATPILMGRDTGIERDRKASGIC